MIKFNQYSKTKHSKTKET